jgi:hypothetical protein
MSWQRANIVAAINFLRDLMSQGHPDPRARAVYEGLLEVLEPARRVARQQRELAHAARQAAGPLPDGPPRERRSGVERRSGRDRRSGQDRRQMDLGPPGGVERRSGQERRTGRDRRSGRDRRAGGSGR